MIKAPLWELESRAWRRHQPTMTVEADADIMFYFCIRGIADMVGPAARLVPVENDPQPTWTIGYHVLCGA